MRKSLSLTAVPDRVGQRAVAVDPGNTSSWLSLAALYMSVSKDVASGTGEVFPACCRGGADLAVVAATQCYESALKADNSDINALNLYAQMLMGPARRLDRVR
jgi:hypothetical protein